MHYLFSKGGASGWHLDEMNIDSGEVRQLDDINWGAIYSGPRYALGGKWLFLSADFSTPLASNPPNLDPKDGTQHVFGFDLDRPFIRAAVKLYLAPDKTHRQYVVLDTSADGRYLLYSSSSVSRSGGFGDMESLMLYDLVEQRAVKKIWEGGLFTLLAGQTE